MTPPHAAICRERAVAAIKHPALKLPPLPDLSDVHELAAGVTPRAAQPHAAAPQRMISRSLSSQQNFLGDGDDDMVDFL